MRSCQLCFLQPDLDGLPQPDLDGVALTLKLEKELQLCNSICTSSYTRHANLQGSAQFRKQAESHMFSFSDLRCSGVGVEALGCDVGRDVVAM